MNRILKNGCIEITLYTLNNNYTVAFSTANMKVRGQWNNDAKILRT